MRCRLVLVTLLLLLGFEGGGLERVLIPPTLPPAAMGPAQRRQPTPLFLATTSALAAAAKTQYTAGSISLKKDADGPVVGTVTPGTPVSVTDTRGAEAHIALQGWSASGSSAVVAAIGQRIVLANLTAPDQVQRQTISQAKDSYGTTWTELTISGWVAASALTSDLQGIWGRARQSYESHCSGCHSLYAADQYSANQWPGTLQNMADRSNLGGEDYALVLKYLQTHAKGQ